MSCVALLAARAVPGVAAGDPSHHLELAPSPVAARQARGFVAAQLAGLPMTLDSALLLTSEVVTNAVLHARTPCVVGVTVGAQAVLVTVADASPETPEQPPIDHERPSGRGLLLVETLATAWGIEHEEHGKIVWFTVARDGSSAGADDA